MGLHNQMRKLALRRISLHTSRTYIKKMARGTGPGHSSTTLDIVVLIFDSETYFKRDLKMR
jgi:hypothetical protein